MTNPDAQAARPPANCTVRRATADDAAAILAIFDEVIEWFVSIGNIEQWGTEPWSTQPRRIEVVTEACRLPEAWVAEHPELGVCGAIVLGEAMPYVPSPDRPELYVRMLIASRDPQARGVGRMLMSLADSRAAGAGVEQLRVDCYAGGSGALIEFYESWGYLRTGTFDVDGWPGQVLVRPLASEGGATE